MSEKVTTRAIILRRVAYGEADWIVTFFSRDHGRMTGMAKSARKSIRRFGSGLEPGAIAQVTFAATPRSDLVRLEESSVIVSTTNIMGSLERIEAMGKAVRLALAFLKDHQPAVDKFDLLENYLMLVGKSDPQPAMRFSFELKWLKNAGYEPMLGHCVSCGRAEEGDAGFSFLGGGMVCRDCGQTQRLAYPLPKQMRETITELISSPLEAATVVENESLIAGLLERYTAYILEHQFV